MILTYGFHEDGQKSIIFLSKLPRISQNSRDYENPRINIDEEKLKLNAGQTISVPEVFYIHFILNLIAINYIKFVIAM